MLPQENEIHLKLSTLNVKGIVATEFRMNITFF
jgi:hypothetical protein